MTQPAEVYKLSDIDVETVGLVTQGANQQTFFLLKSDKSLLARLKDYLTRVVEKDEDVDPPQDIQLMVEELDKAMADTPTPGDTPDDAPVTGKVKAAIQAAIRSLSSVKSDLPDDIKEVVQDLSDALTGQEDSDEDDTTQKTKKSEDNMSDSTEVDARIDKTEAEFKAQVEKSNAELRAELVSARVALEKENTDLKARVEKAEADAARERDARELQVYVQKAATFGSVPDKAEVFGARLHELAKASPDLYTYFDGVLRALDNQLKDNQLFVEKGTSKIPAPGSVDDQIQALVKSGKAKSYKDAVLMLDPKAVDAYLKAS